jgi:hypothetical protein
MEVTSTHGAQGASIDAASQTEMVILCCGATTKGRGIALTPRG